MRNASGLITGDVIQKDMMGARGTPICKKAKSVGITPHEQRGLTAPIRVAMTMAKAAFLLMNSTILPLKLNWLTPAAMITLKRK